MGGNSKFIEHGLAVAYISRCYLRELVPYFFMLVLF